MDKIKDVLYSIGVIITCRLKKIQFLAGFPSCMDTTRGSSNYVTKMYTPIIEKNYNTIELHK